MPQAVQDEKLRCASGDSIRALRGAACFDRIRGVDPKKRDYSAMLSGRTLVFFSSLRNNHIAASALRRYWIRTLRTSPSSPTALQSHIRFPEIFTTISSRCQWPVGRALDRRSFWAKVPPNLRTHLLMVWCCQVNSARNLNAKFEQIVSMGYGGA